MILTTRMTASAASLTFAAFVTLIAPTAQAEGVYIGFDAGIADADFAGALFSDGSSIGDGVDDAVFMGGVYGGYEWSNNVFVEVGYQGYESLTVVFLTDSLEIDSIRAAVGYYLPSESNFHFFGKAGLNFWEAEADRSVLIFGSGEEPVSIDGTDFFAEAGVEYRFSNNLRLGLSLDYSDFGEGSATALKLGFRLGF